MKGYDEVLELLLQQPRMPLDEPEAQFHSALHLASEFGHRRCVRLLLRHQADAFVSDDVSSEVNAMLTVVAGSQCLTFASNFSFRLAERTNATAHRGQPRLQCRGPAALRSPSDAGHLARSEGQHCAAPGRDGQPPSDGALTAAGRCAGERAESGTEREQSFGRSFDRRFMGLFMENISNL